MKFKNRKIKLEVEWTKKADVKMELKNIAKAKLKKPIFSKNIVQIKKRSVKMTKNKKNSSVSELF